MVEAAQAGDRAALEQLVLRYKRPLFALCYGILGHSEDAEDAVQETFLRLLRTLPGYRGDASFRTWLFRVAVNLCLDRKRARRCSEPWNEERQRDPLTAPSAEAMAVERLRT